LFSLSSDNLKKRSKKEINNIFSLFEQNIKNNFEYFKKKKIKLKIIGEGSNLTDNIKKIIKNINSKLNIKKKKLILNIAFNYSSKIEIINSFKKLILKKKKINIKNFNRNLYKNKSPDPEIIIRTGGHIRLSDFLLWQASYSEIFFLNKLWPDFQVKDLKKIINKYQKINRNFGK